MGLSQKLVLKQGQTLVMTPEMQQAIKLLPMSSPELFDFVNAETETNPILKWEENAPARSAILEEVPTPLDRAVVREFRGEGLVQPETPPQPSASATDLSSHRDTPWPGSRPSGHLSLDGEDRDLTANLARATTLAEHLTNQLHLQVKDKALRLIGEHLIGMVNDAGYLAPDYLSVADTLGTTPAKVEGVLAILRTFEPTGVFARSLVECLRLQLEERGRLDGSMAAILDHSELVEKRDYAGLRQRCGVSAEELKQLLAELRTLNPMPGLAFGSEPVSPVVPDVYVRHAPDGTWIVELNTDTLPRVLINHEYVAEVSGKKAGEEAKQFLASHLERANWLVKSLDHRAKTILKVASEIVRQQDAFLVNGVQHLKPITLRTVADAISMHESTVSRVTSNKYMATPRGTFELKYFFTNAIAGTDGEGQAHSSESVRQRVKTLIGEETPDNILSDDDIVSALRREGVELARRTVVKYRKSLGILSSIQRRRDARFKG
jgi:RNA polymerase sigma-54 factor